MSKKNKKKDKRPSSGLKKLRDTQRAVRLLKTKIKRWDRYRSEIAAGKRRGDAERWSVAGLQRHIEMLEGVR